MIPHKSKIKTEDVRKKAWGKDSGCFGWVSVNNYNTMIEKPMTDLSIASVGQNSRDKKGEMKSTGRAQIKNLDL